MQHNTLPKHNQKLPFTRYDFGWVLLCIGMAIGAGTVLTGSKFTIAKACSGKAGDEMVSRANIRMVKANKTTSKNAANIT